VPTWLAVALIAATAALVREFVLALRPPHPTIELGDRRQWSLRRAWRLRAVAALAVILAFAQREAYRAGWHSAIVDVLTAMLLCLALALVVVSVWAYFRRP